MRHVCFEIGEGIKVRGNPNMPEETRRALIEVAERLEEEMAGETPKGVRQNDEQTRSVD